MTKPPAKLVQANPWEHMRMHTAARIALGRVGSSMPCTEVLRFGLAHARARDAVHRPLDCALLQQELGAEGFRRLLVHSQAENRQTYLLRPDLGRRLHEDSRAVLEGEARAPELVVVAADGLSAVAVQKHALPMLRLMRQHLAADWKATPVVIAQQGRVAIGDDIGAALGARLVIVMIGERPGLSSPDSLGIYLTYEPRPGRMDSERNCISNIRPEGLPYAAAAHKLAFLVRQALRLQLSGVRLKDDSGLVTIGPEAGPDGTGQ